MYFSAICLVAVRLVYIDSAECECDSFYNALQKVFGQRRFYTQIGLFPPILAQHPQYKYAIKFDRIPLNIFFSLIHKI